MAKQNTYPMQTTLSYSSGGTSRVELPLSGYITHMDLVLAITVTTSGTTVKEDAAFRLIKSLRIKAAGAKTFVDFSDGRQLKFLNYGMYRGQLQEDTIAASATNTYYYHIPLHLGMNPMDLFDPTVVIPAVRLQDLVMEVTWGTTADIGASGVTNLSASISNEIHEIALSPGERESSVWTKGILSPRFEPKIYSSLALASNLGMTHDLPVGDVLNRVIGIVLDSSGDRVTTDVTQVGFKLPKQRETPMEYPFRTLLYHNKMTHDFATAPAGVFYHYGSQISGRPMGLDLTKAVTGDAQLAFTVGTSGGSLHLLHVMYQ